MDWWPAKVSELANQRGSEKPEKAGDVNQYFSISDLASSITGFEMSFLLLPSYFLHPAYSVPGAAGLCILQILHRFQIFRLLSYVI